MEHAVAFMAGSSFSIIGLSYLWHGKKWSEWFRYVRHEGVHSAFIIGMINLIFGSFLIGFGGAWHGTRFLLGILGALAMAKGIFYLLCPRLFASMLKWLEPHHRLIVPLIGILLLLAGGVILYDWYTIAFPVSRWQPSA